MYMRLRLFPCLKQTNTHFQTVVNCAQKEIENTIEFFNELNFNLENINILCFCENIQTFPSMPTYSLHLNQRLNEMNSNHCDR